MVVLLWQASFVLSIVALFYGFVSKSWIALVVSSVAFLPIAYYFAGAENALQLVALTPVLLLAAAFVFWKKSKRDNNITVN
ncbi:hypothetical protein [Mesobacillus harenae]|uniref:hypothetical protein n=1 Tax=Mesobacillus harenae TaxID=2213203 RepID=UPI001580A1EC|nr:hypothetical protein [Mesobacillus harenae]